MLPNQIRVVGVSADSMFFFQKTEKQTVIKLIKLHLPESTPCKVGHLNVLN